MGPQRQGKDLPPQDPQRLPDPNTHRDDVPLEAMGGVSTLYHGTQLRVAHSCLGSGGTHRTCAEREVDSWRVLRESNTIENDSSSPSYGPAPVKGDFSPNSGHTLMGQATWSHYTLPHWSFKPLKSSPSSRANVLHVIAHTTFNILPGTVLPHSPTKSPSNG